MKSNSRPAKQVAKLAPQAGSSTLTAYLGHIVSPSAADRYLDICAGALIVDGKGGIVDVGDAELMRKKYRKFKKVVDFGNRLIIPGLIDLHLHLPQIPYTGRSGKGLLGWLKSYVFAGEALFADPHHARKISKWFFDELARNGTTLAVVFTTVHAQATDIAFQVAKAKGNRVVMGKVMMDSNAIPQLTENVSQSLKESEALCRKWHGADNGRLLYAFTPRFAVSCSEKMLAGLGKLWAKYPGTYMHTHLAENKEEIKLVAKLFPRDDSYLKVYDRQHLVEANSILAHSIYLNESDLSLLKKRKAAIAHCPSSNFFLKSGKFLYKKVKELGIRFGLGSDIAGGPDMNLFTVMKDTAYMQNNYWISPAELLYRGTLAGAEALNLQDKVGSLEAGKEADFIVVDPTLKTAIPRNLLDAPTEEILSSLVYLGDDRMIVATYVRGKAIFEREPAAV